MDDGRTRKTQSRAQRLIIKRPRLTTLLDESEARVILLVAPAGYGKTTLVREWLRHRDNVAWYHGGPAMADVAALATGLADALADHLHITGDRAAAIARLRVLAAHGQDPRGLARVLGRVTSGQETLVIEDCHHAVGAGDPEDLLSELLETSRARLVVTSRVRPSWITARLSVYGEALIVDSAALAFTDAEANEVMIDAPNPVRGQVLAQARGWPAAIGLAAMRNTSVDPGAFSRPDDLYQFFADDLFRRATPGLQRSLLLLALGGDTEEALTADLLGKHHEALIAAGIEGGFLAQDPSKSIQIHPLLKGFLLEKLRQLPSRAVDGIVARYVCIAGAHREWDHCRMALEWMPKPELIIEILERALAELLEAGRVATVKKWLKLATGAGCHHAALVLAEAEVALRDGDHVKAQVLGERSAMLSREGDAAARAHLVAARAAHLRDDPDGVLRNVERAEATATTTATKANALWIYFSSALERGDGIVSEILDRLRAFPDESAEFALRLRNAEGFMLYEAHADVRASARAYELASALLPHVHDPFSRTALLNQWAYVLTALGSYEEALRVVQQEIAEAEASGLQFAVDHGLLIRTNALIGLRKLQAARQTFEELRAKPRPENISANARIQLAKLRVALGDLDGAAVHLQHEPHPALSLSLHEELLAYSALIHAARGDVAGARNAIAKGERASLYGVATMIRRLALAILAVHQDGEAASAEAVETLNTVIAKGHVDATVTACRAFPRLAEVAAYRDTDLGHRLSTIFASSRDTDLGRRAGIEMPRELRRSDGLSPREREVYEHLIQGRSNREIATALFISESTTKVHVRHIFEKLGVHSRAEAAMLASRADV